MADDTKLFSGGLLSLHKVQYAWPAALAAFSFCAFWYVNYLSVVGHRKHYACTGWNWRNIFTSAVHSLLCGLWACTSFLVSEDAFKESTFSKLLLCISFGYLTYDLLDIYYRSDSLHSSENKWIMLHHIVLMVCMPPCYTYGYSGHALATGLSELNSFNINTRKLLRYARFEKSNIYFKMNSVLCLVTCLVFRFYSPLVVMYRITKDRQSLPLPFTIYITLVTCLLLVVGIGIRFFFVILQKDVLQPKREGKYKP